MSREKYGILSDEVLNVTFSYLLSHGSTIFVKKARKEAKRNPNFVVFPVDLGGSEQIITNPHLSQQHTVAILYSHS